MEETTIRLEFTPNPNTLKYTINRELLERGTENFLNRDQAFSRSPLALIFFDIPGVEGVMIGSNFVTITFNEDADIDLVNTSSVEKFKKHIDNNEDIFIGEFRQKTGDFSQNHEGRDKEIVTKVIDILEREIRPAVALDGGDIVFDSYKNGILALSMIGSCAGCPSSTMTLKDGIETRMKQEIPEITEVISV